MNDTGFNIVQSTELLGSSPQILELKEQMQCLIGKPWVNILILGESGTGKEVVARMLHAQERRSTRPFIPINMAAVPTRLFESELFGVEKGAYTDASYSRAGKAELAHKGDLFLDEIGDLDGEAQAKLLRLLQEKTVQRLGSNFSRKVDIRVISATNKSIARMLDSETFRVDLLYRLADVTLYLPPLKDRKCDIELLANHFFEKYRNQYRLSTPKRLGKSALITLLDYHWPGNIRQLESTIKRALIFSEGEEINDIVINESFDKPRAIGSMCGPDTDLKPIAAAVQNAEKELIESALIRHQGNATAARQELRITRATFYRKLKMLDINPKNLRLMTVLS